jgi:hypothetical protein
MSRKWLSAVGAAVLIPLVGAGTVWARGQAIPELDPGSAVSGMAAAVGAILFYLERRRSR